MTYTPRLPPRAHQAEYVRRAAGRPAYAGLMDMGTGKTKSVLDEWGASWDAGESSDLLLVAPAGCVRNWDLDRGEGELSELRKHLDPAMFERLAYAPVVSGASAGQRARVAGVLSSRDPGVPRFLSVNVEALSTVKAARDACEAFLKARPGAMIVVDESTCVANSESSRSQWACWLAGLAARRRILTGLPSPDSPLQLYGQFALLDWRILGHRTWWGFKKTYAVTRDIDVGSRKTSIVVGYRDVEDLTLKIAPHSYRVRKEDCLDLPPKTYLTRDVQLTAEQLRVYREVRDNATARLASGDHVSAANVAVQMMRLQQVVCGHVTDESGVVRPVPNNRLRDLLEVLDGHGGKAVVWTGFDPCVRDVSEALERAFGAGTVARFWGGNVSTRLREEAQWKQDARCRFMVATQSAGGQGNTWVKGSLAVYYSNTQSARERLQSEDRTHRDGMTEPCAYLDLVARGTVDERLLQAARRKISLADLVAGDDPRRWVI